MNVHSAEICTGMGCHFLGLICFLVHSDIAEWMTRTSFTGIGEFVGSFERVVALFHRTDLQ
jgi:hypothetical protein